MDRVETDGRNKVLERDAQKRSENYHDSYSGVCEGEQKTDNDTFS